MTFEKVKQWFRTFAAHGNHPGNFLKYWCLGPTHPQEILTSLVWGTTWALGFFKAPQLILTCSQSWELPLYSCLLENRPLLASDVTEQTAHKLKISVVVTNMSFVVLNIYPYRHKLSSAGNTWANHLFCFGGESTASLSKGHLKRLIKSRH